MKKIGNKAFSLVEIVVVIAIISIVSAGSVLGVGALIGWKARQFSEELVSVVREAKTDSMGKDEVVLRITNEPSDGYYYAQKVISEYKVIYNDTKSSYEVDRSLTDSDTFAKEILGKTRNLSVSVALRDQAMSVASEIVFDSDSWDELVISFDRNSGSFIYAEVDGTKYNGLGVDKRYVYSITVKQGSKTKTVKFEQLTGQVYSD